MHSQWESAIGSLSIRIVCQFLKVVNKKIEKDCFNVN